MLLSTIHPRPLKALYSSRYHRQVPLGSPPAPTQAQTSTGDPPCLHHTFSIILPGGPHSYSSIYISGHERSLESLFLSSLFSSFSSFGSQSAPPSRTVVGLSGVGGEWCIRSLVGCHVSCFLFVCNPLTRKSAPVPYAVSSPTFFSKPSKRR